MGILHSFSYNWGRYKRTQVKYWRIVFWKDFLYVWGYVRAFFKAFRKPHLVHTKESINRAYPLQIVSEGEILAHIERQRLIHLATRPVSPKPLNIPGTSTLVAPKKGGEDA